MADYYTTGEGCSPAFWPTVFVVLTIAVFVIWRFYYYFKRWKQSKIATATLFLACCLPLILGADTPVPPPKVETSIGIYDVQSKDDLLKFSSEQIRELVKMEDDRTRGAGRPPHPILVYCFEEQSFQYTGGRYDNAEVRYRLRVPSKIVPGKKYPLAVHLHGVGEAGRDNTFSLAHLHSILPLMVGPEQQDFYLLVLQCPPEDRAWRFKPEKDGNLDVVVAATSHAINNNPIDEKRLSVFGLSSGGTGVWEWAKREPDRFAAAVPTSCGAHNAIPLVNTSIWTFYNRGDGQIPVESIHNAMRLINASGGFMKLTQFDQGGHAAWRPAMDEYNCFAWLIAQKRGGWFNPPPERKVYQGRSLTNCFFAFFLPLGLATGLFIFQRSQYCERLHERFIDALAQYRSRDDDDDYDDDEDEEYEDDDEEDFRIWTDTTGTKEINAKVIGFQGDNQVCLQSPTEETMTVAIKLFCVEDQKLIREIQAQQPLPEGFRRWANFDGTQLVTAKFAGFQPDGKAMLQLPTGQALSISVDQFGQGEQEFLTKQRTESLPDGFREWRDLSGTHKTVAKLLGFQEGKARFEFQDGRIIVTPIHQFIAEDQVLLTRLMTGEEPPT